MATSYGSITIVDVTDIGELSLYPTCNLPKSVIYVPDDNTYSPNWSAAGKNLQLTPVIYYAGTQLTPTASGLSITWTRRVDTNTPSAISSSNGENVNNGILTVSQNQFNPNMGMLTYICTVSYTEPETHANLTAEGQITFDLVKQASTLKKCTIIGEQAFKYASDQSTYSPTSITLTAQLTSNLTNGNWQFKNSNNEWTNFSTTNNQSINGTSIIVKPNESGLFVNRIATIRKLCSDYVNESDPGTYDIHTIVQLYDGAAGNATVAAVLDNEDQFIPCDSTGTPTITLTDVFTTFTVYEGGVAATDWTYQTPTTDGTVTGTWDSSTHTWHLATWPGASDSATITFSATKTGNTPLTKYLQLTKIKTGQDGTSPEYHELVYSAVVLNRDISNVYTPNSVSFSAKKVVGVTKTDYTGYVTIYENGTSGTNRGGAMTGTPPTFTYTPSGGDLEYLTVYLYQTGGGGDILDRQTINITSDGATGQNGEGGINIIIGNPHEGIACTNAGKVKTRTTVTIPFTGYKGTERQACSITSNSISGVPTGCSVSTITNDNGTTPGSVQLIFDANSTLGGSNSGEITLNFSISGTTVPIKFSWAKQPDGMDGASAILLQCYAPGGDIIYNGENNVTLTAELTEGGAEVTPTSYQWKKWQNGSYQSVTGGTSKNLTVTPSMVDGYAAFQCVVEYNGEPYYGYIAVQDKSDPIQVQVYSTLGETLINGIGDGAVYARIMRNGEEIDELMSGQFVTNTSSISNPNDGDYCYLLNTTNKTCTLMQYNGTAWRAAQDPYDFNYTWTFRDITGNATTYNGNAQMTGKALYLGKSVINRKLVMDVMVEEKS